jgi:hypothetical protein
MTGVGGDASAAGCQLDRPTQPCSMSARRPASPCATASSTVAAAMAWIAPPARNRQRRHLPLVTRRRHAHCPGLRRRPMRRPKQLPEWHLHPTKRNPTPHSHKRRGACAVSVVKAQCPAGGGVHQVLEVPHQRPRGLTGEVMRRHLSARGRPASLAPDCLEHHCLGAAMRTARVTSGARPARRRRKMRRTPHDRASAYVLR